METLDGNALAGLLADIFGEEMTSVIVTCQSCRASAAIAETVVYPNLPGAIARCRSCTAIMLVITQVRGMYCVDTMGLEAAPTR